MQATSTRSPADRSGERVLWGLIYGVLALAPVAFLAAAPESEDSDDALLGVAEAYFEALATKGFAAAETGRAYARARQATR